MKWITTDCSPGDMIRIHVGAICHYGIYCSDDEVIEFGAAPLQGLNRDASNIRVMRVNIDEFACGKLVEVASLDFAEKRRRFSPKKTIERARARIGEGGYDILKNNCEHFANECVFGKHVCKTEEEARERWRERPALDVYLADLSEELSIPTDELPKPILRALKKATSEEAEKQRFLWKLLIYAASKSFAYEPGDWKLQKDKQGAFTSNRFTFSFCTVGNTAIVAISHRPMGLSAQEIPASAGEAFFRSVEAKAKEACRGTFVEAQADSFCGVCETTPPLYLAVAGENARMTLVWRYDHATGRTLKKLLPLEQSVSL